MDNNLHAHPARLVRFWPTFGKYTYIRVAVAAAFNATHSCTSIYRHHCLWVDSLNRNWDRNGWKIPKTIFGLYLIFPPFIFFSIVYNFLLLFFFSHFSHYINCLFPFSLSIFLLLLSASLVSHLCQIDRMAIDCYTLDWNEHWRLISNLV